MMHISFLKLGEGVCDREEERKREPLIVCLELDKRLRDEGTLPTQM